MACDPLAFWGDGRRGVLDLGSHLDNRHFFGALRNDDHEVVGAHHAVLLPGEPLEGRRVTAQTLNTLHQFVILSPGLLNLPLQSLSAISSCSQVPIAVQGSQAQQQQKAPDNQCQPAGKGSWRLGGHVSNQRALRGKAAIPG